MTITCDWVTSDPPNTSASAVPARPVDPRRQRTAAPRTVEEDPIDLTGRDVIFSSLLNHLAG